MLPEALSSSRIAQLDLYLKSRGHEHYDLDPLHWKDDYDAWLTPQRAFREDWWRNPLFYRLVEIFLAMRKKFTGVIPPNK